MRSTECLHELLHLRAGLPRFSKRRFRWESPVSTARHKYQKACREHEKRSREACPSPAPNLGCNSRAESTAGSAYRLHVDLLSGPTRATIPDVGEKDYTL